jgi:hypothetical protein
MKKTYTIEGAVCTYETDMALCIEADELDEPLWVPKSQIDDDSEVYGDQPGQDEGDLIISEWFARNSGLL